MDWRHKAACQDEDPELFFWSGKETAEANQRQIAAAKAVCRLCPVRTECLEWALKTGQDDGVWGGASVEERRTLRALRRVRQAWIARHGRESAEELIDVQTVAQSLTDIVCICYRIHQRLCF